MYGVWKELYFGTDGDPRTLSWVAPSRTMNPALPKAVVDKAMARRPGIGAARSISPSCEADLADFIPGDVIERRVSTSAFESERR